MAMAPLGSLNAAVEHASAILATDPIQAQREAEAILAHAPKDPRALLVLASARRRQGDAAAALAILDPLASTYPRAAHTRYELGCALAAQGRTPQALAALRLAVTLKPDLAEAWRTLGQLLFAQGDNPGAEAAFAAHARAMVRDPALAPAADALYRGQPEEAEQRLRDVLISQPNNVAALRLMAEVFARLDRYRDAEALLEHALSLEPGHEGARFSYANALYQQQKGPQAAAALAPLLAKSPSEAAYLNLRAGCLTLMGELDEVIAIYEALLQSYPKQSAFWLNYGHALRMVGRREDAVAAYRQSIALQPGLGDAYWSLANLKVAVLSEADTAAMAAELQRPKLSAADQLHLHYALGKAMEDRGDYADSFAHYAAGARIHRKTAAYDADRSTAEVQRSCALFTSRFFAERQGAGAGADDPIFILGLPRSGSTLVEQILASHSAVEGAMELPDIGFIAQTLGWPEEAYPGRIADLDRDRLKALGEGYLDSTRIHRKLGRPLFIDKMPQNFLHVGLIQLILPNARIIDARRHPMGTCFSAFKQHFAKGMAFSYDLTDLGRYYRDYVALMAHFDAVLPGRVCRVIYEDLVQDTEAQVRLLLDFCCLPFEASCLEFHNNRRAVRTVSSEQVRRPIFREGLDQWRHYQPWLGPLQSALGPALEHWRDGAGFVRGFRR
jgi:tetratricopeptide (TPR) repeat protein